MSSNNPFVSIDEISRDTMLVQQFLCLNKKKKKKTREISPYIDYSTNQFFVQLIFWWDYPFHYNYKIHIVILQTLKNFLFSTILS